ncbi:MFS transporter [uncultured Roseivirga sp.]|uniref:MFS transporter n=1 Tax=uncultured Roseivirga sp. TaxID=543088 RepID=UPI0030D7E3FB|tara:strand:+ start:190464 stop:191879 length:1416 start_codon:yes stop_codon:yes gene_type:complete
MSTITNNSVSLHEKRWMALTVLCAAQFMVIMDTSIIGVALPAIQSALNYTPSELQWIFNAYVIVLGGVLLLGGKLSDLYRPKNIFMWGFGILTAASLLTGLAWSEMSMNAGRALQGLGAALIAPSALTLLMTIFTDPKELGKAFGFWGASAAAGGSAGVFLGGVLTEYVSWRWTFFINIPLALVVMVAGASLLVAGNRQKGKIDYLGALLVTAATMVLVYALVMVDKNAWTSPTTLGLLGISLLLFIVFIVLQRKLKSPLLPLSIFKVPNLSVGNIVMALMAGAWIPLWFYLNLYLQQTLGYSAFYSGLALLPMTITIMVLMVGLTGKLIAKFGYKLTLITGLVALTASLIWFSFVPVLGNFLTHVLGASLLGAIGMSLAYIPGTMAAMSGAKPEEAGLASGLVSTTYQVGSAIGLAIAVAIAIATTNGFASGASASTEALNAGFQSAFRAAAVISGLGVVIAFLGIKQFK